MKRQAPQLSSPPTQPSAAMAQRPLGKGMPKLWRATRPDRDARLFLRLYNLATRVRPIENYSLWEIRRVWRLTALALGRRLPVAEVSERQIDGPGGTIALRVYKPRHSDQPLPAFLWCHGGGFVVGDLDTADSICRSIALAANCICIAVRYRLAPEHDLNAGREDFLAALRWIAAHGAELGIDSNRLAVGGDSAGGNIAAAVAQECLRSRGPKLSLQVLAYPATELALSFPSLLENAEGYLITGSLLERIQQVAGGALAALDPTQPWLSPRRNLQLAGLAPALLVSAGFDPIRDDGLDYACRLRDAQVPVELLHYPGQFHGFLNFDAIVGAGGDALERIGGALARAFSDAAPCDRTLEITEEPGRAGPLGALTRTSLTIWRAGDGWRDALLRQLSPSLARVTHHLLAPWRAPAILLRRLMADRLDRQVAQQTYRASP